MVIGQLWWFVVGSFMFLSGMLLDINFNIILLLVSGGRNLLRTVPKGSLLRGEAGCGRSKTLKNLTMIRALAFPF
jgi:hypothetical protein